jgi:hypothetical protein
MSQPIFEALMKLIEGSQDLQLALAEAPDLAGASRVLAQAAQACKLETETGQIEAFLTRQVSQAAQLSPEELDQVAAGFGDPMVGQAAWMFKAQALVNKPDANGERHFPMPDTPTGLPIPGREQANIGFQGK